MENYIPLFDSILIDRTDILSQADKDFMAQLQTKYEKAIRQIHGHFLLMKEYAKEHPTKNLKKKAWCYDNSGAFETEDKKNELWRKCFIPENIPYQISRQAMELTEQFENSIWEYLEKEYKLKMEKRPVLHRTLFHHIKDKFKVEKSSGWRTEFTVKYNFSGCYTLPDDLVIPSWKEAVKVFEEQLGGMNIREKYREQQLNSLKDGYWQIRTSGDTLTFKPANYILEKTWADGIGEKTFFRNRGNNIFELLMFYENRDSCALPAEADQKTRELAKDIHGRKVELAGSGICNAITLMNNNTVKLHFNSDRKAAAFRDWCLTDENGKMKDKTF